MALFVYGRLNLREQFGQVAKLQVVAGPLDCAARGMSEHHNEFRSGHVTRELETAEDVGIDHVAGDAYGEDVAQALVKDQFGRRPAVDTADNGGKRPLAVARLVGLLQQVAAGAQVVDEAGVTILEELQSKFRGAGSLSFRGVRFHGELYLDFRLLSLTAMLATTIYN